MPLDRPTTAPPNILFPPRRTSELADGGGRQAGSSCGFLSLLGARRGTKTKVENKVSGVRCKVSGAVGKSKVEGLPAGVSQERLTFKDVPSRNVYENKGAQKAEVSRLIPTGVGRAMASAPNQEMKVHPEMLLKTKDCTNMNMVIATTGTAVGGVGGGGVNPANP